MEVELEVWNGILKICALNYSKSHGARDLIGKKYGRCQSSAVIFHSRAQNNFFLTSIPSETVQFLFHYRLDTAFCAHACMWGGGSILQISRQTGISRYKYYSGLAITLIVYSEARQMSAKICFSQYNVGLPRVYHPLTCSFITYIPQKLVKWH